MGSAEAAKSAYEAFSKGDLETLKEGFAEEAEWQTSDELPLGGVTRGRDAIATTALPTTSDRAPGALPCLIASSSRVRRPWHPHEHCT